MKLQVSPLRDVEQARAVRQLFLDVYGEAYPIALYYEPENLWKAHQHGDTICQVALDENKKVVGHCALYRSAPNPRLLEVGAGLVHPSARGSGGIGLLLDGLLEYVRVNRIADWVFGEAVCNHAVTQRTLSRAGFVETALEVDLMPAAAYTKEASASGRVSTLLSFFEISDSAREIHMPRRYKRTLEEFYGTLKILRTSAPTGALANRDPVRSKTQLTTFRNQSADLLRLQVQSIGKDLAQELVHEAAILQLTLPLADPCMEFAVDAARANGFFLGGLLPCWGEGDHLLLQRLKTEPVWDSVALDSERSRCLLRSIREDL